MSLKQLAAIERESKDAPLDANVICGASGPQSVSRDLCGKVWTE
jgi:hypothetical protein